MEEAGVIFIAENGDGSWSKAQKDVLIAADSHLPEKA